MTIKPFDDLDITDPIMFGLVFSNTHIAKCALRGFTETTRLNHAISHKCAWRGARLTGF